METKVYENIISRDGWPQGEWDKEPDKVQYPDPVTGYPCLAKRNQMGVWCGYVGVPEGHPAHGKGYGDVEFEVHGGLTYADNCQDVEDEDQGHAICHIPGPGEPKHMWWLGYDCGHGFDRKPAMEGRENNSLWNKLAPLHDHVRFGEVYRTLDYVKEQNASLASQLHAMVV